MTFERQGKSRSALRLARGNYKCGECDSSFDRNCDLNRHNRIHMKEDMTVVKPYKCDHCEAGFVYKGQLKSHIVMHTGEKPYKCEECGYAFGNPAYLKSHIFTHTDVKLHACVDCGMSFVRLWELRNHELRHKTNICLLRKPHPCDEFGATFASSSMMNCHKGVHTGEKPYSCMECDSTFVSRNDLKGHKWSMHAGAKVMSHVQVQASELLTPEKPYKCKDCCANFVNGMHLKLHTSPHAEDDLYVCDVCGSQFVTQCDLLRHGTIHKMFDETSRKNDDVQIANHIKVEDAIPREEEITTDAVENPYNSLHNINAAVEKKLCLESHVNEHDPTADRKVDCDHVLPVATTGNCLRLRQIRIRSVKEAMSRLIPQNETENQPLIKSVEQTKDRKSTAEEYKPHRCDDCGTFFVNDCDLQMHHCCLTVDKKLKRKIIENRDSPVLGITDFFPAPKVVMYIQ